MENVCVCIHTYGWLHVSPCSPLLLCHYIFSVPSILFFSNSFPSSLLLHLSSLLLFSSLFCKLGALARRRISLFGKSLCGANAFFSYSLFLYIFLFWIKTKFGIFSWKHLLIRISLYSSHALSALSTAIVHSPLSCIAEANAYIPH